MNTRPADPCRVPLLRRERAVLMRRFNQRVNPQHGPFCELRHKIYLNDAVLSFAGGATKNAAPAEPGRRLEIMVLERGALE